MLAVVAVFSAALGGGAGAALAASNRGACAKPKITSDVIYHEEKVKYDLEVSATSRERTLGLYVHESRIGFKTQFEGACALRLDLVIEIFPTIRLLGDYKKKRYRCARRYVLDHEREHGRVVLESHKKFARELEKLAAAMFSRKGGHEAAVQELADELKGGPVITKFKAGLDKRQDAFHAKEHSGKLVSKKCRMKERK